MARFILIHGSCHGAWCWRDVVTLLEAAGHEAEPLDLPSHGEDNTPINNVTLGVYTDTVIREIEKSDDPVVLVGHSAAGVTIASVAERIPDKINRLIYVCAYAPKDGDALHLMRKRAKRQLVMPAVRMAEGGLSYTVDPDFAPGIFYHDCPAEAVQYALPRLGPQAVLPQQTPVSLGANYDSVKRYVILGEDDHTIPPEEQENIVADWPPEDVYRLNCGHSPFFSHPETLARMLGEIAGS